MDLKFDLLTALKKYRQDIVSCLYSAFRLSLLAEDLNEMWKYTVEITKNGCFVSAPMLVTDQSMSSFKGDSYVVERFMCGIFIDDDEFLELTSENYKLEAIEMLDKKIKLLEAML